MRYFEKYAVLFVRVYLGTFNLVSGSNYFLRFLPQPVPDDTANATFMHVTMDMGLFQIAKCAEILAGLCLLSNQFVPLALVILFPVSLNILVMNTFNSPHAHVQVSGARNFAFHVLLLAAYARCYVPLLKRKSTIQPLWRGGAGA
jgi:putative oxidoreductase